MRLRHEERRRGGEQGAGERSRNRVGRNKIIRRNRKGWDEILKHAFTDLRALREFFAKKVRALWRHILRDT